MKNNSAFRLATLALALTLTACGGGSSDDDAYTSDLDNPLTDTEVATAIGVGENEGVIDDISELDVDPLDDESEEARLVDDGTVEEDDAYSQGLVGQATDVFYFSYDSALLDPQAQADLDATIDRLVTTDTLIILEGHADERGTREYNLALGENRAKSIKRYMSVQGVAADRIEVVSYGEEKPAVFGFDETSWGKNRRVELKEIIR